jgi:hypothetical protein
MFIECQQTPREPTNANYYVVAESQAKISSHSSWQLNRAIRRMN